MAKAKKTTEKESVKPTVASDAPALSMKTETGILQKETNENSEIDWRGTLSLSVPGEYWLDGYVRKNGKGDIEIELQAKLKEDQTTDKNLLNNDRGVLFKNNRKKLKHHPDYTGNIATNANGEFQITGIIVSSKTKVTYMELEILDTDAVVIAEDEMPF